MTACQLSGLTWEGKRYVSSSADANCLLRDASSQRIPRLTVKVRQQQAHRHMPNAASDKTPKLEGQHILMYSWLRLTPWRKQKTKNPHLICTTRAMMWSTGLLIGVTCLWPSDHMQHKYNWQFTCSVSRPENTAWACCRRLYMATRGKQTRSCKLSGSYFTHHSIRLIFCRCFSHCFSAQTAWLLRWISNTRSSRAASLPTCTKLPS